MAQRKDFNSSAEDVSILSSGVKVEGKLYSEGNVRIDGEVTGDITVNGNLTLGDGSEISGDVKAKNITISGKLEGTVQATEKLILEASSSLKGDIFARILVVEEGAKFDGKSSMSQAPTSPSVNNTTPSTEND
ncbi:MAG: polymer-forming cytoskeletal protein [Melioribacteraceae bacterium]|nr:polymer-forming cytoskeletal protein [Melioribacteraceae bacterium]MCF8356704.1 polymer-forming cytoskeletal protein [Melioribacteraceae bacterium]MCF8418231.1 polymer-forming cytoskeletal protein [Melioribacteraceae bacterium]